jgi:S1-C subfamily serine protease
MLLCIPHVCAVCKHIRRLAVIEAGIAFWAAFLQSQGPEGKGLLHVQIRPAGFMNILRLRHHFVPRRFGRNPAMGGIALALLAMAVPTPAQTDIRRDAVVEAVEKVMPCVVNVATESVVEARDPFEELMRKFYGSRHSALGSGVIISDDGYLLTNLHVVNRATRIQVKLSDAAGGGVYGVQHVYVVTPKQDVALLKIIPKKKGQKFKAVQFAKNDDLLLGETVLALGNPFGLGESVSRGILSSKSRAPARENEDLSMENWLQTDALINPGNSGGPLIDLRGELVGINVAILEGAQGIGFAIPIKEVREALGEMFNPETASRWFGARVGVDLPLVVQSVESNSPAGLAGLQTGDTILRVNGKAPGDFMEFNRLLREEPKLDFDLTVERAGQPRDLNMTLLPFAELFRDRLGVDLQDLTPDLVDQLGLGSLGGVESGLFVTQVEKGSPADDASLSKYCVINGIGGRRVRNDLDVFLALSQVGRGKVAELSFLVPQTQGDLILGYQEELARVKLR